MRTENDRIRFTINPKAQKEVRKRLLALNHEGAKVETDHVAISGKKPVKKKWAADDKSGSFEF